MKNMCKEDLMKIITQASFAMDDTRLFLDTHPNCTEAITFHQKMEKVRQEAWDEYTKDLGHDFMKPIIAIIGSGIKVLCLGKEVIANVCL